MRSPVCSPNARFAESRNAERRAPWSDRSWQLASLLRGAGHGIQLCEHIDGAGGEDVFRHAYTLGLEGIVAKRRDQPYRSGRSPDGSWNQHAQ